MKARMTRRTAIVLWFAALMLSGCAGTVTNMKELPAARAPVASDPSKAMIVFLRPSGLGFGVQSSVFEVKDNVASLIGIVAAKAKVAYQADPGKHLFMVIGENADFMTADVLAGKTYYVIVEPRMGMWKARFGLEPVRKAAQEKAEFKSSLAECKWVGKTPASENWALGNMASIQSKRADFYPDWLKRPDAERPNLAPEDGQ